MTPTSTPAPASEAAAGKLNSDGECSGAQAVAVSAGSRNGPSWGDQQPAERSGGESMQGVMPSAPVIKDASLPSEPDTPASEAADCNLDAGLVERLERSSAIIANDDFSPPMTSSRARRVFVTETIIEASATICSLKERLAEADVIIRLWLSAEDQWDCTQYADQLIAERQAAARAFLAKLKEGQP